MTVRVAGGQGFYGDAVGAVTGLLDDGVDYLCLEALAELTLAILQKDRQKDEAAGFTKDLGAYLRLALPHVAAGRTKVITNAGGINPVAAARLITSAARDPDLSGFRIATVLGDDVLASSDLLPDGFPPASELRFANAYLGARPVVEALEAGADLVLCGRVADAALFCAPLVHEHGWGWADWDRLAAGMVVGHLLECSGQVTGGNHGGRWWEVREPWRFAFPLADVAADGTAEVFKPAAAGGQVTFDTVRQQLLYEVHDPAAYVTPDVVVDMTTLTLDDLGGDRVRVTGVTGRPATDTYKVVGATEDGWAGDLSIAFAWPDAEAKARAAADIARKRIEVAGIPLDGWHVELFGAGALHGPAVDPGRFGDPPDVVLRLA